MRIAQRMVSRNYMKQLNTSLGRRSESLERQASGLKFNKLSDNVADGARAMHLQEERYKSTRQMENTENLLSEMNSVDGNMDSIQSIMEEIQEKVLQGMSEEYGQDKRDVLAKEVASKKDQILQFANAQFGGKYLFGGTNNSAPPFTVVDGKLAFNGIEVDRIYKDTNGKFVYDDGGMETPVPNSDDIYADIGLGLKIDPNVDADPRTAFKVSFSGLEMLGFGPPTTGKNGTEVASNVFDMLTQVENALTPSLQKGALDDLHTELVKQTDRVGMSRTDLGTRMDFLERTRDRLESDINNMGEMESNLISVDPAGEAINTKQCEYVWMAILQLGNQILPTSLLDFMR